MKIEKLNENQIRCTLTHADLAARHLKLSELAYGTEKAKSLFRDMMQQASFDFGFEAEDIPLMIEAIPASADSIVLIITKVEDPEELDTRFSKFTSSGDTDSMNSDTLEKLEGAEEFLNLLNKVKEAAANTTTKTDSKKTGEVSPPFTVRLFSFETIDAVIQAARLIAPIYQGSNTLYHDTESRMYILALAQAEHEGNEFNKICNMLSEYGSPEKGSAAILAFLEEHCEIFISANAVQKLSAL
ncbi:MULTISPECIES: adaptor protein MecA [Lachnospiraceae]|jgi:adapter protein MecA 1/2|uniref:Adaptor protein MecA n=1 Tax=Faecalicatena acetigenes TaxID=2981790 RepID=A0ABT2TFV5_9FIRM|nr:MULTISPECIES: adaptor protein MecA [Lachnospiraceae]MCU6748676.1 adaptor protein MecA [Faecalicatena acetigenes]RGT70941.1 adaptor protein MecA [Ruminococcus sp. AF18-22]SCI57926.1 Adapter protein mecA 2 [uncultured Clostridium sp.]